MQGDPSEPEESNPRASRRADRRVARWLFACALLFYLPFFHGHFGGTDETSVFEATRSLSREGNFSVGWDAPYHHEGRDGRLYSHFAVGQSVLAIPFFGLGRGLSSILPPDANALLQGRERVGGKIDTLGGTVIFTVALYAPVASALLVTLFFFFERSLGVSRRSALLAAALLGTTTYVAPMSVYFLRHTTEALAILGSLLLLQRWGRGGPLRCLALGSGLACATILVRVPAAIVLPAIGFYVLWLIRKRTGEGAITWFRALLAASLPALVVGAIHVATNFLRWGTFIASPMLEQTSLLGRSPLPGLAGFLVSPGASIFLYSPLLLLTPITSNVLWRRDRALLAVVLAVSMTLLFFCSSFLFWTGLPSAPGPRYLFVVTPLLMLPLGLWLDSDPSRRLKQAVAVLAVTGLLVQIGLMSARWSAVFTLMDYMSYAPLMDFVFEPGRSPILGSWLAVWSGEIDSWFWGVWRGWNGNQGAPLPAIVLLAIWGMCATVAVRGLRRSLEVER
jgi:hypothetical protein